MAYFQKTDESGVLYLASGDNVAVATRELVAGSIVNLAGTRIELRSAVGIGHKFAMRPIKSGKRIIKYDAPIGSASADIAPGEFAHIHNLQSDCLPSYTLDSVDEQE